MTVSGDFRLHTQTNISILESNVKRSNHLANVSEPIAQHWKLLLFNIQSTTLKIPFPAVLIETLGGSIDIEERSSV